MGLLARKSPLSWVSPQVERWPSGQKHSSAEGVCSNPASRVRVLGYRRAQYQKPCFPGLTSLIHFFPNDDTKMLRAPLKGPVLTPTGHYLDPDLFDRWGRQGLPRVTGIDAYQAAIDKCVLGLFTQKLTLTTTQRTSRAKRKRSAAVGRFSPEHAE